ncbi:MAG: carbohydrate ABC transporter permease [Lachnospiraceae bacterium]|nr:carbohydrate ABC transporter permease [Lachnospiraceae bacterium]
MEKKKRLYLLGDILGFLGAFIVFIVPFLFMMVNALKERREANLLSISFPKEMHWENFLEVFQTNDYQLITAFKNSGLLVIGSVIILILVGAMAGYVLQRRNDRVMGIANSLIMAGLMVPAAILPTIWVLQRLQLYKTLLGMILIEVALQIPFTIMLYRGFMGSIPIELEEAGYIDGCSRWKIFSTIIFPLLKPVTSTVIILNAVTVFNDFTNPLYFLPGSENATVQLTLYNFMGQYSSSYNMLFADVILITIPMLILFIFFNKRIVEGMVAGAVKG